MCACCCIAGKKERNFLPHLPPPGSFFAGASIKEVRYVPNRFFPLFPHRSLFHSSTHFSSHKTTEFVDDARGTRWGFIEYCATSELRSRRKNCNALAMNKIASLTTKRLLQDQEILPLGPSLRGRTENTWKYFFLVEHPESRRMSRWTNKKYFPSSCSHLCVTFLCGKLFRGHFMIRKIALASAEALKILEIIPNQFLAVTNAGNERRLRRKKKKIHSLIMCSCLPLFAHSPPPPLLPNGASSSMKT